MKSQLPSVGVFRSSCPSVLEFGVFVFVCVQGRQGSGSRKPRAPSNTNGINVFEGCEVMAALLVSLMSHKAWCA